MGQPELQQGHHGALLWLHVVPGFDNDAVVLWYYRCLHGPSQLQMDLTASHVSCSCCDSCHAVLQGHQGCRGCHHDQAQDSAGC